MKDKQLLTTANGTSEDISAPPQMTAFARLSLEIAEAYVQYREEHRQLMSSLYEGDVDLETFTRRSMELHLKLVRIKQMRERLLAMKPRV